MKSFNCFRLVLISTLTFTSLAGAQTPVVSPATASTMTTVKAAPTALATPIQPVAQSLVIECKLHLQDATDDSVCGPTTVEIKNLDTKKSQSLTFDGEVFTIPVHTDFGRFKIHVQPKRCPKNKDYKTALVGSITTLTFEHCH